MRTNLPWGETHEESPVSPQTRAPFSNLRDRGPILTSVTVRERIEEAVPQDTCEGQRYVGGAACGERKLNVFESKY